MDSKLGREIKIMRKLPRLVFYPKKIEGSLGIASID